MDVTGPLRTKGRDAYGQGYRFGIVFAYVYPRLHHSLAAEAKPEEGGEHGREERAKKAGEDKEVVGWKELFGDEEEGADGDEKDADPPEAKADEEKTREEELATDTLYFFRPMKTKNAKEVFEKVKEVYLQLRNENLPVIRINADRAQENYSAQLRAPEPSRPALRMMMVENDSEEELNVEAEPFDVEEAGSSKAMWTAIEEGPDEEAERIARESPKWWGIHRDGVLKTAT